MKNCAFVYIALLHRLLPAPLRFAQNIPVPKNDLPIISSVYPGTQQISCSMKYSLLSLLPLKSSTWAEKTTVYEYDPLLPHSYLSQNQTPLLSYKISPLPSLLSHQPRFSSYISGTIPDDICFHKQHDSYFSIPHGYYINAFPIDRNPLMRFSSPTKSRSIQSLFS